MQSYPKLFRIHWNLHPLRGFPKHPRTNRTSWTDSDDPAFDWQRAAPVRDCCSRKSSRRSHTFSNEPSNQGEKRTRKQIPRTCWTKGNPPPATRRRSNVEARRRAPERARFLDGEPFREDWFRSRVPASQLAWKQRFSLKGPLAVTIRACRLGRSPITDHRPRGAPRFSWCPRDTGYSRGEERRNDSRRSTTNDLRNRPGESRLGERRTSDWLSHDLPEVPEAIQDPSSPSTPL